MDSFTSLIEVITFFDSELKALKYLEYKHWGGSPMCPHCQSDKVYRFKDGTRFKCGVCRQQFTAKVGTIFEGSKIGLRKWYVAIYLVTAHKKGISSHQLAKDIKVTQKTAWFMLHRIRFVLGMDEANMVSQLEEPIEVDEVFVGSKNKNLQSQGRSFKDKTPVMGVMQKAVKYN